MTKKEAIVQELLRLKKHPYVVAGDWSAAWVLKDYWRQSVSPGRRELRRCTIEQLRNMKRFLKKRRKRIGVMLANMGVPVTLEAID